MVAGAVARVSFFGGSAFVPAEPARLTRKAQAQGEPQVAHGSASAHGAASPDLSESRLPAAPSTGVPEAPQVKALAANPEPDGKESR